MWNSFLPSRTSISDSDSDSEGTPPIPPLPLPSRRDTETTEADYDPGLSPSKSSSRRPSVSNDREENCARHRYLPKTGPRIQGISLKLEATV